MSTLSRKPPVQEIPRISARGVAAGSVSETRVAGVLTASFRLSRQALLTLNHDVAPGFSRSLGFMTSSAWMTANGCARLKGLRFATIASWLVASSAEGVTPITWTSALTTIFSSGWPLIRDSMPLGETFT